ncbi:MAG: CotH kinase family protein, partial [Roseibacillus sp.]
EPAITGGYLFKKDKGQTVDVTFTTSQEGHQMAFVEPDTPNAQQQAWLDNYVDSFENALHGANFDDPVNGYANYIDVDSFIDTHIWVELFKNIDGYRLSSYFYKDRGRKLVASPVWDYNLSLGNANYLEGQNATGWYYPQVSSQQYPFYSRLFQDPEFVARYWDRWYELRDGMFGTTRMLTLIDTYTAEIAEGAVRNFNKWNNLLGNYTWPNADGYASRTTHQAEVDWMKTWLSTRLDWIDGQHAKPPVYNLASGSVSPGSMLTMTNPNSGGGTIYYTTDGSDPRVPGNATNNTLLPAGSTMRWIIPTTAITNWNTVGGPTNLASWGTGNAGIGYENSPADYAGMINTTVPSGTTSVYTRFTFNIPDQATIDAFDTLSLNLRYDDGFVAYLSGATVASPNAPVSPVYNSTATDQHVDSAAVNYEPIDITVYLGQLQVGTNVLAIQLLNRGTTSSDLLLDPQVVGGNSGALISPTAQVYGGAFPLNSSQTVQARTLAPTGWSAMETETFLVSSQPASSTNLAVSEFNYRPGVPTPAESALGFDVRTDFEYLEVMNISAVDVDLTGVQFTTGVQFEFDLGEVPFLSPGERVLIVSNRSAFEQRYAPLLSGFRIAGEFTNNLSNDGETVILTTGGGTDIRNFTYNDVAPWPEAADGSGRSLVLRNPANDPDHNLPGNWRASSSPNGSPGTEDLTGG